MGRESFHFSFKNGAVKRDFRHLNNVCSLRKDSRPLLRCLRCCRVPSIVLHRTLYKWQTFRNCNNKGVGSLFLNCNSYWDDRTCVVWEALAQKRCEKTRDPADWPPSHFTASNACTKRPSFSNVPVVGISSFLSLQSILFFNARVFKRFKAAAKPMFHVLNSAS